MKQIKIINFLHLDEEKYFQILKYRNQEFIKNISLDQKAITIKEHENYRKLLEKKDEYFAFLITCDGEDYGVISLKDLKNGYFRTGDYLVDEDFKFGGGGVVISICEAYLFDRLNIKFVSYEINTDNKRALRNNQIIEITQDEKSSGDYLIRKSRILNVNSLEFKNLKAKKLFDKLYKIEEILI